VPPVFPFHTVDFPFQLLREAANAAPRLPSHGCKALNRTMGSSDQDAMKKLLLSIVIVSSALGTHASATPDLALVPTMNAPATATQLAASDVRLLPSGAQSVSVQLVGIGDSRMSRTVGRPAAADGNIRDGKPPAEGLPSTPIALATLLLLLCRLIGRRSN
jgi:hypothetical protein